MQKNAPDVLYKFRSFNVFGLKMLIDKQMYFAAPDSLNDPLDCQHYFSAQLQHVIDMERQKANDNSSDIYEFLPGLLSIEVEGKNTGEIEPLHEALERKIKKTGVFSTSANVKDALMWAHYGDSHRGFCIGFKRESLEDFVSNYQKYDLLGGSDVTYSSTPYFEEIFIRMARGKKRIIKKYGGNIDDVKRRLTEQISDYIHEMVGASLSIKSDAWKYEQEYRLVRSEPGMIDFSPDAVTQIVFGCKAAENDVKTVLNVLAAPEWRHVEKKRVELDPLSFNFRLVDF